MCSHELRVQSGAWLGHVAFEFGVDIPRLGADGAPPGTCRISSAASHTFPTNALTTPIYAHPNFAKIAKFGWRRGIGGRAGARRGRGGISPGGVVGCGRAAAVLFGGWWAHSRLTRIA